MNCLPCIYIYTLKKIHGSSTCSRGQMKTRTGSRKSRGSLSRSKLHPDLYVFRTHPNLDGRPSGSAQPVAVGREAHGADVVTSIQSVQVLALVQVPQHGLPVLLGREGRAACEHLAFGGLLSQRSTENHAKDTTVITKNKFQNLPNCTREKKLCTLCKVALGYF